MKDIRSIRESGDMSEHFLGKAKITFDKDLLKTIANLYQEKLSQLLQNIREIVNLNKTREKVEKIVKSTANTVL